MNQDKIWNYFQNDKSESFDMALPRFTFLCKKLKKGQKVLNIGVGNGSFEKLAQSFELDIHSLDPNKTSIDNLKKKLQLSDTKAKVGYSQAIPFDCETFDSVVMSEVLEHLPDGILNQTLLEVKRILKNNGNFLITVPLNEVLLTNQAICPNCEFVFHRWGHVQSFTKESLEAEFKKVGFVIKTIEIRCFPDWTRNGIVNFIKSLLRYFLGRFGAGIAQANIFLIAIKKEEL